MASALLFFDRLHLSVSFVLLTSVKLFVRCFFVVFF